MVIPRRFLLSVVPRLRSPNKLTPTRPTRRTTCALVAVLLFVCAFGSSGCGSIPGIKRQVTVPSLLTPVAGAGTNELIAEVNKNAGLRSINGKVDIQFLDTSFAKCGVAEKYRTAEGDVIAQRDGQVYVSIKAPFGYKIAEMTSDGEHFRVAVFQGDERYKRFVRGTNNAAYPRIESPVADGDCGNDDKKRTLNQERTVGALSGLRPQHFTDALLIRPVAAANSNMLYTRSEIFQEEPDDRPTAKRGQRVVRSYYLLDELAPEGERQARILRRFWFDRYQGIRLARLQTFDDKAELVTDVLYKDPKSFGAESSITLPARIELTRPQDRYAIRISYQTPNDVVLNRPYDAAVFVLENKSQLPEVDLDRK